MKLIKNTILVGGILVSCPFLYADEDTVNIAKEGDMAIYEPRGGKNLKQDQKIVEVCFVLDTTGSMGSLIEGAKQKIWQIASEIAQLQGDPEIRFSLIAYRDRGDKYVTQLTDLNEDLDVIHDKLMKYQAAGGGDTPESVNQALNEAVTKINWTKGDHVSRVIFLVGDAPPQTKYKQDVDYAISCKAAKDQGIIINSVQCGNMQATIQPWKHIAKLGGGEYVALPQDGGVVAIDCPQDVRIAELTRTLNKTVVPYGDAKRQLQATWKVQNSNKLDMKMNSSRASCLSSHKGSYKAFLGDNDLVSEWGDKKVTLKNLKQEHLPKEMQKLSKEDLTKHLEAKIKLRVNIKKDMLALLAAREKYLASEMAKKEKGAADKAFDNNVNKLLKKQIK